jgi:hypothetical protein
MVEVSRRSCYGSIGHCHVHDLLHDVAIEKAKEENFLTVCSTPDEVRNCAGARRVAVHQFGSDGLVQPANLNLRTLFCFSAPLPNYSEHRILKVLSVTTNSTNIVDESYEGLTQLRYLQFKSWLDVKIDNPTRFIKAISGMKFLQILDLKELHYELSDFTWEWDMETLRHVILPEFSLGPPSWANLRNLQTLCGIKNRESWGVEALPYLPNLCKLKIKITDGLPWKVVVAFLHTLKSLVNLDLKGHDIPIEVIDMRGFPFYQQLTCLKYQGKLADGSGASLDVAMFPTHLTVLTFHNFRIPHVVLVVLKRLHNLKQLHLISEIDEDLKQMKFFAGDFSCLELLDVFDFQNLEEWEIEQGAIPMLRELCIDTCPMLQVPLGLKHLITLRKVTWVFHEDGKQSATTKAEELRNLCKHVPDLNILRGAQLIN